MNATALEWLASLRRQIEQADTISIQTVSTVPINEAAALIRHTDTTEMAEARARAAVVRFCSAMAIDITGKSGPTQAAREDALQAIETYATRVRSAPASPKAENLRM